MVGDERRNRSHLCTHWCKHRPIRRNKCRLKVITWTEAALAQYVEESLSGYLSDDDDRETLFTEVIMSIHATFAFPFVNKVISLHWSKHKRLCERLLSHSHCCRQRPVVLLGPDEVLANVNWPSIQHNQMEMKVQMHRFIIYARVILIKQTKAALAGGLWHCGIHDHIKHQHPPKEMKYPLL